MRILVADAVAKILCVAVVGILEIGRDRKVSGAVDLLLCRKDGLRRGVGLWRRRDVLRRLGEDDLGLRPADALGGKGCRHRNLYGLGIRIAHVLTGADHDPPCDEHRVLSRPDHAGKVVDGGIRIGAAHALDKGGDRVVVAVPGLVVVGDPLLDALPCHIHCDVDLSVRRPLCREDCHLDGVQRMSCISPRHVGKEGEGIVIDHSVIGAKAPLRVMDGPPEKHLDVLPLQGLKLKDHGP